MGVEAVSVFPSFFEKCKKYRKGLLKCKALCLTCLNIVTESSLQSIRFAASALNIIPKGTSSVVEATVS